MDEKIVGTLQKKRESSREKYGIKEKRGEVFIEKKGLLRNNSSKGLLFLNEKVVGKRATIFTREKRKFFSLCIICSLFHTATTTLTREGGGGLFFRGYRRREANEKTTTFILGRGKMTKTNEEEKEALDS